MTGARPISGDFGRWGQIHGDFMGRGTMSKDQNCKNLRNVVLIEYNDMELAS